MIVIGGRTMSSIEANRADGLALALFDEMVTPLSKSLAGQDRRRRFSGDYDGCAETYFERPQTTSTAASCEFPGGGRIDGLVDALASFWADRSETELVTMRPRLLEIAMALQEENEEAGGEVDIFCYTMF